MFDLKLTEDQWNRIIVPNWLIVGSNDIVIRDQLVDWILNTDICIWFDRRCHLSYWTKEHFEVKFCSYFKTSLLIARKMFTV